ncbi:MAG: hypothetical protein ACI4N3_04790 [Alphaproteobacteria bacterium]
MKKFLICALFLGVAFSNNSFSQDLKLMNPVKLKNPENKSLGFKTPVPTFTLNIKSQKKTKPLPPVSLTRVEKNEIVNPQPVNVEKKPEPVVKIQENSIEETRTDKNINEARELLRAAERLANSIKDEKDLMEDDDVKILSGIEETEPVNIVVKFTQNQEEVSSDDMKKITNSAEKNINNPDVYFKIISYYDNPENRNIAFSRLLNTRKILLDKGIKTSQTMIMVLEDDTKEKSNTVEILF